MESQGSVSGKESVRVKLISHQRLVKRTRSVRYNLHDMESLSRERCCLWRAVRSLWRVVQLKIFHVNRDRAAISFKGGKEIGETFGIYR